MSFEDLMNDTIDILKASGEKITGLKASVQRNKIFMDAGRVLVEPNDLIVRRASNGAEETFRVIDPCFYEAFHGIAANYQMQVEKLGLPEARAAVQHITYNISGQNARLNQSSTDNSVNTIQIDARAINKIELLRKELEGAELSNDQRTAAHELVDEVEAAFKSGKPKKSIVSALLSSLPHVANVATIAAAIAGMLS